MGHLFQGRFKALLVDADEYLKHLSRYIHLNPVRAKMVESASDYPWSSYPFFIGKEKMPKWLAADWLLSQFGKNLRTAKKNDKAFVEGADPGSAENPGKSPAGGFILGGENFVARVKEQFLSPEPNDKEKPQLKALKPGVEVIDIVSAVGESFGIESDQILTKGKKKNVARDVAIYLSRNLTGISGKDLGEHFGNVSGAAIAMRHKAVADQIKKDKKLNRLLNRLEKKIINI
ncbi:MAG: hypothetical protein JEZ11_27935 [Desulfobacterales bacterium]|nr:hypothetical protein [Desulfobacterales bacterium]